MKFLAIVLSIFFTSTIHAAEQSQPFDYTKIKPEHFDKLEDKQRFTDEQGLTFKIENTKYARGIYIQHEVNGTKRWKKHGAFYRLYEGRVTEMQEYVLGEKHGLRETYRKDGKVQFREHYQHDKKHGLWEQFNDKGNKVAQCDYVANQKHGKCYDYHSNGEINFDKDYVNGKRHGQVLQYRDNGKLVGRSTYNEGKQVGKTIWTH